VVHPVGGRRMYHLLPPIGGVVTAEHDRQDHVGRRSVQVPPRTPEVGEAPAAVEGDLAGRRPYPDVIDVPQQLRRG
jgi:hypothetical protein